MTYPSHRWTGLAGRQVDDAVAELKEHGYIILRNRIAPTAVRGMNEDFRRRFEKTPFCQGNFYGSRTKRFSQILKRTAHAEPFVRDDLILAIAEQVMGPWCERIQLGLTQAIEMHPGSPTQAPHRDQEIYPGPRTGGIEYMINVMFPLTRYTRANGATLIWPGSHRADPDAMLDLDAAVPMEMEPGDAVIWLGSTMHSGGANVSSEIRRGLIVNYSLGWLKPFEINWLAYPPEVARHFDPALAGLLGYCHHRPSIGMYDGRCPSILLGDEPVRDFLGTQDAMNPDQQARIGRWMEIEKSRRAA
jgi:ectoine hydroxylase-related dioxygenase (phytanoyl-CoA dioxygenase family)